MTTSDQIKLFCIGLSVVLKHRPATSVAPVAELPPPALEEVEVAAPEFPVEARPEASRPAR